MMSDVPDTTFDNCKYKSIDELTDALGLVPFEQFAARAVDPPKYTGRTTRLITYALLYSQLQPVVITSHNHQNSYKLQCIARDRAITLGLDPKRILDGHIGGYSDVRSADNLYVFDHTYYGL
jgi:hypothetical protein